MDKTLIDNSQPIFSHITTKINAKLNLTTELDSIKNAYQSHLIYCADNHNRTFSFKEDEYQPKFSLNRLFEIAKIETLKNN